MVLRKQQGLSANERIKSKKTFNELYSSGKILISRKKKIKSIYIIKENSGSGVKIAAVVSKKLGNAVWRNRIKRLIREAYRKNKTEIVLSAAAAGKSIDLIFSAYMLSEERNKKIRLDEVLPEILEIMKTINQKI